MEFRGTVQGEAALKYSEFCYRKPIMEPLTLRNVDPDRLDPMHEFPRFCPPPSFNEPRIVDLANYMVKFKENRHDGMTLVEVWMLPNEYTAAREPWRAAHFHAANAMTLRRMYVDEALTLAFRPR